MQRDSPPSVSHPPTPLLLSLTAELCKTVVYTCCLTSFPPSHSSAHSLLASILSFTQLCKFEAQAPTWSVAGRALPSLPPLTPKLWPPEPTQFLGAHSLWLLRLPMHALLLAVWNILFLSTLYQSLLFLVISPRLSAHFSPFPGWVSLSPGSRWQLGCLSVWSQWSG